MNETAGNTKVLLGILRNFIHNFEIYNSPFFSNDANAPPSHLEEQLLVPAPRDICTMIHSSVFEEYKLFLLISLLLRFLYNHYFLRKYKNFQNWTCTHVRLLPIFVCTHIIHVFRLPRSTISPV